MKGKNENNFWSYCKLSLTKHVNFDAVFLYNTIEMSQVSSMIHSARHIVTQVANIVFCCFVFLDLSYFRTYAKTMIPTGRDYGLAEWINVSSVRKYYCLNNHEIQEDMLAINDPLGQSHYSNS